jgi:hypothetical protein
MLKRTGIPETSALERTFNRSQVMSILRPPTREIVCFGQQTNPGLGATEAQLRTNWPEGGLNRAERFCSDREGSAEGVGRTDIPTGLRSLNRGFSKSRATLRTFPRSISHYRRFLMPRFVLFESGFRSIRLVYRNPPLHSIRRTGRNGTVPSRRNWLDGSRHGSSLGACRESDG